MFSTKKFFSEEQSRAIVEAITRAELNTSGEIRLHIEPHCKTADVLERATAVFFQLKMDKTANRNGVLIYLAHEDHKFAILGDEGINRVVPANFWDGTKEVMKLHFQNGEFFEGIAFAIEQCGEHLKQYFPYQSNDKNELSNEISEG